MSDDIVQELARYDEWVAAQFAVGQCPWSGYAVHECHRSVCDCFDAEACATCSADDACESCGRRGRDMVTATIGGEAFRVCSTCGDDARENGCEVAP